MKWIITKKLREMERGGKKNQQRKEYTEMKRAEEFLKRNVQGGSNITGTFCV